VRTGVGALDDDPVPPSISVCASSRESGNTCAKPWAYPMNASMSWTVPAAGSTMTRSGLHTWNASAQARASSSFWIANRVAAARVVIPILA
jgi:hypothetical protein